MEISRKDRIESKSIGYYTIIGIFFAAFLVIEPIMFTKGVLIRFSRIEIISIVNYILVISYIVIFIISIIILHNNYKPKPRPEFDPIRNWDLLLSKDDNESLELIKNELFKNIDIIEKQNNIFANKLGIINKLCIFSAFIIIDIFAILAALYIL